jgi:integrase
VGPQASALRKVVAPNFNFAGTVVGEHTTHLLTRSASPRVSALTYTQPHIFHLRDGEVVLYRRGDSPVWQCRFKLQDGSWLRLSTKQVSVELAVAYAANRYDETRYRQRLGLAHTTHTFAQIAHTTLAELREQIALKARKSSFDDYVVCIERYFVPYFGERRPEELIHTDIWEFEQWRNRQLGRMPASSTLKNFAAAWSRLRQTAINKGWISEQVAVPKLTTRGEKTKPRAAFDKSEIDRLLAYMVKWSTEGRLTTERDIRPLLRDYVEILLYTGMRHGTEAMGLCWNNIEWHTHEGQRYLRMWVDGKTGGRWLVAKHKARDALIRLQQRQPHLATQSFDSLLSGGCKELLFKTTSGYQPRRLDGTFRRLLRDCGLEVGAEGQRRTLYSLRRTYATLELVEGQIDIHTLAKQMGNSAAMIERHYSKLTATMAADKLA